MDKVTAFFVGEMLKIQEEDPERFWEIKNYECPHHYGIPSFKQDHTCEVNCRIGSLEISIKHDGLPVAVNCRIGSLEIMVNWDNGSGLS